MVKLPMWCLEQLSATKWYVVLITRAIVIGSVFSLPLFLRPSAVVLIYWFGSMDTCFKNRSSENGTKFHQYINRLSWFINIGRRSNRPKQGNNHKRPARKEHKARLAPSFSTDGKHWRVGAGVSRVFTLPSLSTDWSGEREKHAIYTQCSGIASPCLMSVRFLVAINGWGDEVRRWCKHIGQCSFWCLGSCP